MRKSFIFLFCTVFLFSATHAMAVGLGPYLNYEKGNLTISDLYNDGEHVQDLDIDFDNDKIVIGFLLDSCVARDSLFNYRLNIGFSIADLTADLPHSESTRGYGFDMKHAFGFGFFRNERVRVWAGPAIKFYTDVFSEDHLDILNVGVGGGPELGVNIHVTDFLSIGLSFMYSYNFIASAVAFDDDWEDVDDHFTGSESMFLFQVAPIFRLGGDKY